MTVATITDFSLARAGWVERAYLALDAAAQAFFWTAITEDEAAITRARTVMESARGHATRARLASLAGEPVHTVAEHARRAEQVTRAVPEKVGAP